MRIKFHYREQNSRDFLIRTKSAGPAGKYISVFLDYPALHCGYTIFVPCTAYGIGQPGSIFWDEPDIHGSFEQGGCLGKFFKHFTAFPARFFHIHTNDGQTCY
jgi:hypothetical protein